jgi:hypothetical protein
VGIELDKMLKGDSYWSTGSTAEVVKADKKGPKGQGTGKGGAAGVKVGKRKGKSAKIANKDPAVLKAQQAAKQLLAARKVFTTPCQ